MYVRVSGESCVKTQWKMKTVKQWESNDIMCWIIAVADEHNLHSEDFSISQFNDIDGTTLCNMSEADFMARESRYGKLLFSSLQQLLKQEEDLQMGNVNKCEFFAKNVLNVQCSDRHASSLDCV
jgi:hypothetical protein